VLRIAAALMLMSALAATLMWISSRERESNSPSLVKAEESKIQKTRPAIEEPLQTRVEKRKLAKYTPSGRKKGVTTEQNRNMDRVSEPENSVAQSMQGVDEQQKLTRPGNGERLAGTSAAEKPIVLEYHLETISPPDVESALVSEHREKTSIQKVIDFALDAKNGESHFGDLRQVKDELFALNFRKDKQSNHK
jgi:acyl transferase domain-containing protein